MISGALIIVSYLNLNFNLAKLLWPWKGSATCSSAREEADC